MNSARIDEFRLWNRVRPSNVVLVAVVLLGGNVTADEAIPELFASVAGSRMVITVSLDNSRHSGSEWHVYLDAIGTEHLLAKGKVSATGILQSTSIDDVRAGQHTVFLAVRAPDGIEKVTAYRALNIQKEKWWLSGNINLIIATVIGFVSSSVIFLMQDVSREWRNRRNHLRKVRAQLQYAGHWLEVNWESADRDQDFEKLLADVEITELSVGSKKLRLVLELARKLEGVYHVWSDHGETPELRESLSELVKTMRGM